MSELPQPIADRVREYLGRNLVSPEVVPLPGGGAIMTSPARFDFSGDNAVEKERLARAAAKASGIVPLPEDLTAEAMAYVDRANAEAEQGAGGPPQ